MAEKALHNTAAGSHSEHDDSAKSQDVSRFLQSLTDRQLQVILGEMRQMFTRDEITTMNMDIEKIVTTLSQKVIVPKVCGVLNVDARSLFLARPGSSNHSFESVTKEVLNAIVKTIIDALDDSHMCEVHRNVTEKTELLASSCGSVELRNSSLSVEPRAESLTSKDQAQLQEWAKDVVLEVHSIYRAKELKSASDLSCPPKMCATDFAECLLSELVDMATSSRSSSISDDISSDPACGASDSMADKALKRAESCHRIPSLVKLTNMACKMETSVPAQTLRNASLYAKIVVDELLVQLDSFTKSEVSEDAQSVLGLCASDTSLISELLVDHLMAYIQEFSGSSFGDGIPATALDCQVPSFCRSFSAKSFQKIQSEDTRTKAAQEVSKILLQSSSFLMSSPRSRRAHTSQRHCSVEPTPSECLVKAFDLVDSVVDGICEHLDSRPLYDGLREHLDWMESGVDVPEEILWYTACSTYNSAMRHLRDFSAKYQQKPPKVDPLEINVGRTVSKISHPERPSVVDEDEPPKNREKVSMASLLDTMMATPGLQSSGPFNSLEELSAAAERVEDLFSTTAPQELANMVQLILTDRLSSLNMSASVLQHHPYLQRPFASEFLVEFADKAVKCLLMSCIAPRPASTTANDIPSLVMPFRVTPESFEISRPPSEVFSDTMDLFSEVIVNSVMDKVSALSDHELDAVDSNAEETSGSDSHSSEELNTCPPTISVDALRCCVRAILHKVQEMSSTGVHGSPLLIDEDQVQNVTDMVKGILALFTAVTVEDGEHALKKLHRSIIEAVYAELLQRLRSKNQLIEAVKAQSELLAGSLAVSIVRAIKSADPKDLYRPASVESGSSSSIKEEPLVSSQTIDDVLSSHVSSRDLLTSETKDHAILATWLVLRTLAQSATTSSDVRKEASSNDPKELIERILSEFSASSSAAKLEEALTGTFLELLQRFGEEGSLHKALNPRDSAFDEALMTALRKHLDADASTAVAKTERAKNMNLKKLKNIFNLKMPKLSIFKKKSRKDNNAGHTSDQDHLQSRRTADMGGSNSAPSKKEKPRRSSIFTRMFSCFRKISCLVPL